MLEITAQSLHQFVTAKDFQLKSTQSKLSVPIIKRLYAKMKNDLKFENIKVCDGLIIDGHHRFIAATLANKTLESTPSATTSATNEYQWKNVEFVEDDWDTLEKIEMLNQLDAEYNGVAIEKVYEMTK